ncbi:MAG: hypothetical protein IPP33_18935 [Flavobacteriales bacterium]|nr:hypothetical protein [Flavobacteriales bacterium]
MAYPWDFFQGRITFPSTDLPTTYQLSGRTLKSGQETPEAFLTALRVPYVKSALYGISYGRKAIAVEQLLSGGRT